MNIVFPYVPPALEEPMEVPKEAEPRLLVLRVSLTSDSEEGSGLGRAGYGHYPKHDDSRRSLPRSLARRRETLRESELFAEGRRGEA